MKLRSTDEQGYGNLICQYLQQSFPKSFKPIGSQLLDILTVIIIGSKELRFGSMPPPENQVKVRNAIKYAITNSIPIPIMVPWGGRKMSPNLSIDIAEVNGLKRVLETHREIKKYYEPGIKVNVRIEDSNALWLYKSSKGIYEYTEAMKDLIQVLNEDNALVAKPESSMMKLDEYISTSEKYSSLLYKVILLQELDGRGVDDIPEYDQLIKLEWKGEINKEQREYYLNRYASLYPENSSSKNIQLLADYFAGSKARYDLNGRGNPSEEFIQWNYSHPVPGAPEGIFSNTIYRRTNALSDGRTHIAPWRGKGYLEIDGNEVKSKITHQGNREIIDQLISNELIITNDSGNEIKVQADYLLKS